MPDRRQGDRRDTSGISSKKLVISLTNFIMLCVLFVFIIIAIFSCKYFYNKGYNYGYIDTYDNAYNQGYSDAFSSVYGDYYDDEVHEDDYDTEESENDVIDSNLVNEEV